MGRKPRPMAAKPRGASPPNAARPPPPARGPGAQPAEQRPSAPEQRMSTKSAGLALALGTSWRLPGGPAAGGHSTASALYAGKHGRHATSATIETATVVPPTASVRGSDELAGPTATTIPAKPVAAAPNYAAISAAYEAHMSKSRAKRRRTSGVQVTGPLRELTHKLVASKTPAREEDIPLVGSAKTRVHGALYRMVDRKTGKAGDVRIWNASGKMWVCRPHLSRVAAVRGSFGQPVLAMLASSSRSSTRDRPPSIGAACSLRRATACLLQCAQCGGPSFCEHGKRRTRCKECGGGSVCEHRVLRSACRLCGGGSICEHKRQRCVRGLGRACAESRTRCARRLPLPKSARALCMLNWGNLPVISCREPRVRDKPVVVWVTE